MGLCHRRKVGEQNVDGLDQEHSRGTLTGREIPRRRGIIHPAIADSSTGQLLLGGVHGRYSRPSAATTAAQCCRTWGRKVRCAGSATILGDDIA